MILQTVWDRFRQDWKTFGLIGLWPTLVGFVAGIIFVIIMVAAVGSVGFRALSLASEFSDPMSGFGMTRGFNDLAGMLGSLMLLGVLGLVLGIFGFGLTYGGLLGGVIAGRRGQTVTFDMLWSDAKRYMWPLVGLGCLVAVTVIGVFAVVGFLTALVPFLGILLFLAMIVVMPCIAIALGVYPAYAIVSDNRPVMDAYGQGWRLVTTQFGEVLLSGLMMLAFAAVFGIASGILNVIPLLGWLASLVASVFYTAFITWYFAERFEQKVRPYMQPPAA